MEESSYLNNKYFEDMLAGGKVIKSSLFDTTLTMKILRPIDTREEFRNNKTNNELFLSYHREERSLTLHKRRNLPHTSTAR